MRKRRAKIPPLKTKKDKIVVGLPYLLLKLIIFIKEKVRPYKDQIQSILAISMYFIAGAIFVLTHAYESLIGIFGFAMVMFSIIAGTYSKFGRLCLKWYMIGFYTGTTILLLLKLFGF
ncbi:MAG: hypothetical protein OEY73_03675 [Hadesarchaea archaeon]|nr:hypothetical protein [Hadesarchaea archaeon]